MLWVILAFLIGGALLNGKGKKEDNGTMKVIGAILLAIGIGILLVILAYIVFMGVGLSKYM